MKTAIQNWLKRSMALTIAGAAFMPLTAQAHDRIDTSIRIGEPNRRVEPVTRIWIEPVYRTVSDRVWVEPVYQTVCDNVWVPERCDTIERVHFEHGRRLTRIERVIVPGHYDRVERRVLVTEGHFQCVERQELVCAGHFETQIVRVDRRYPFGHIEVGLAFR